MRIYPAIDIKDGKCVRLFKGQFSDVTVYGDSPAEMAKKWESLGGEYIHVVDLDGALKGHGVNAAKIKEICESVNVPVQTGGGIRTMEDIEAKLACGIDRVIINYLQAISDPVNLLNVPLINTAKKSLSVLTQKTVWWLSRVGKKQAILLQLNLQRKW